MKYRSDVDGMRALAILPVLLFHAGFGTFSGGYIGVDIFFVISGFVITSKLLNDIDEGHYSIGTFYVRRIRRLLPAMTVTLGVTFLAGLVFLVPPALTDLSWSLLATIAFSANMYFWKNSGYFEVAAQARPLLHMWSLAVEEQFYLFIPVVIYVLQTRARRLTKVVLGIAALASLVLSAAIINTAPTANFFLLPTRAWELLAGSLVAARLLPAPRRQGLRDGLGLLGLALMIAPIFLYDEATPFPGLAALPPTLGTALAIYAGSEGSSWPARWLSHRILVGIGAISYSLYLVHWPLIVYARTWLLRELDPFESGLIVFASFALAYLQWRFIEVPFRHPRVQQRQGQVFATAGGTLAALAAIAATGILLKGLPQRMPDYHITQIAQGGPKSWLDGRCFLINQNASAWAGQDCVRTKGAPENALLWGDSFAAHYIIGLLKNQDRLTHNLVQYTFAGCPPVLGYRSFARPGCEGFNERVFDVIKDYDIKVVIIAARWDQLRQRGLLGLAETVARIRTTGAQVYVIGQSPMFSFDTSVMSYRKAGFEGNGDASWYYSFDPRINQNLKNELGGVGFIDPTSSFCRGRRCEYMRDGNLLFDDYGHFSVTGSDQAVRAYFPIVKRSQREAATPAAAGPGDGAGSRAGHEARGPAGAVPLAVDPASR